MNDSERFSLKKGGSAIVKPTHAAQHSPAQHPRRSMSAQNISFLNTGTNTAEILNNIHTSSDTPPGNSNNALPHIRKTGSSITLGVAIRDNRGLVASTSNHELKGSTPHGSPTLSKSQLSSTDVKYNLGSPALGTRRLTLLTANTTTISDSTPNKRLVEDKVEKLVALREAIGLALREIFVQLDKIEVEVKGLQAVDADVAKKLRELVKFLRNLVESQADNPQASVILSQHSRASNLSVSGPDRLEFFKGVMSTALVEIRCKLGSVQKRVADSTSLTTSMADAQTIRSVKQYLDGKGTLEIDPKKHKVVHPPTTKPSQQEKYVHLLKATLFSSNDIIGKLQPWLKKVSETMDPSTQATTTKRAREIKDIFDEEEEEMYIDKSTEQTNSGNSAEMIKYVIMQIENNAKLISEASNEPQEDSTSSEKFAFIIRFARKLRRLKKYILRTGKEDGIIKDDTPIGIRRLTELLNKERADPKDESSHYEIQEDISALNTRRHLLTLSIRNLDRKINFLIKSRKHKEEATEMEEEEVYQFFDQTTNEENPLGTMKEHYEQFISILRKQPRYLAAIVPYLSFVEMESLVQTITFSLFSDLYLAREEYLMLSLIEAIMTAEFVRCKEVDQYLRANNFITKLLAGYTKRQSGRLHLVQALRNSVLAVVQDAELDLEMDTSKLYKIVVLKEAISEGDQDKDNKDAGAASSSASVDSADVGKLDYQVTSEHPEVKRVFNEHKFKLIHFCKLFLDNIISSLPTMPFGIRWVTNQLVVKAREKFPGVTDVKLDLLIGGFIFLRYVVPAIVAPESHGIVSHITQKARRNLILIAKVLQNLANNCPFSKKEPFMSPMNTFLEENQQYLHEYFVQVMNVGDYSTYYRMSSLKRAPPHQIERTVTISPNELYDIHRKLVKHEAAVIPVKTDPLAVLLAKMGTIPENLPRRQNKFVLLNVYSMPEPDKDAQEVGEEELFIQNCKDQLTRALALMLPPIDDPPLKRLIEDARLATSDPLLTSILTEIGTNIEKLPRNLQENNYEILLQLMEKDYQQRSMVREALLTEKVEQLEALDHQKREVARLLEEKKIYSQYLQNVMLDAYMKKIRNKPMIGPYKFSIQQLERRGVIVPTPNLAALRSSVEIKMSCTNPGSINITTKYRKFSRFFELQLLDLMDDLVLHDTVNYDDIVFDTRKLISFINKYILG